MHVIMGVSHRVAVKIAGLISSSNIIVSIADYSHAVFAWGS